MNLFKVKNILNTSHVQNNIIKTPLGELKLDFHTNDDVYHKNVTTYTVNEQTIITCYENDLYEIEVLVNHSLNELKTVEDSIGVIWRFRLKSPINRIIFQTVFDKLGSNKMYHGRDHGEDLHALKWSNENYQLHIGTQDEEVLNERMMHNDYLPIINDNLLAPFYDDEHGMNIMLENIEVGKIGQVHFVIAWSKLKEYDLSSWFAVDLMTKEILPDEVEY